MASPLTRAGNNKIGTCPHGLPLGACPICNGMGGGGSTRAHEKPKAGEMSWEQCYAMGQMMKAQKHSAEQAKLNAAQQAQLAQMQVLAQQIASVKNALMSVIPTNVVRIFDGMKNLLLTPVSQLGEKFVNTMQNIGAKIADFANTLKEKLINITDKLAAMFGEMKNAVEKKISEKFKDMKKKIFNLFGLANADNDEDEEVKQIEEQNRQEEMKKLKDTVFNLENLQEYDEEDSE